MIPFSRVFASVTLSMLITLSGFSADAYAKRLGGGRSFGQQSHPMQRQAAPAPRPPARPAAQPAPAGAPAPAAAPKRPGWLGPVAGLAAGLGIAALLSHFGLAGAAAEMIGSLLLIGLLVFGAILLFRMLSRPKLAETPNMGHMAYTASPAQPYVPPYAEPVPVAAGSAPLAADGIDVEALLHDAKVMFTRMQLSWDAKNAADIRVFTTPEIFAEIKVQIDERDGSVNRTDVLELNAEFLGSEARPDGTLASVRFSGMIREEIGGGAEPFVETWNLLRQAGSRWLLAGIEQEGHSTG